MQHETEAEKQLRISRLREAMLERMHNSGPASSNIDGRMDPGCPKGKGSTFTPSVKSRFKQRKRG